MLCRLSDCVPACGTALKNRCLVQLCIASQVISLRLNVRLSPDQERQLLEATVIPTVDAGDNPFTVQTSSYAVTTLANPLFSLAAQQAPALVPAASQRQLPMPSPEPETPSSGLGPIPDWAAPTPKGGAARAPSIFSTLVEGTVQPSSTAAGPHGYQPDFVNPKPPTHQGLPLQGRSTSFVVTDRSLSLAGGGIGRQSITGLHLPMQQPCSWMAQPIPCPLRT